MASKKRKRDLEENDFNISTSPNATKDILPPTDIPDSAGKKQQKSRSLFIRSLAPSTTTEILVAHFSAEYPIKHGHAVTDPATETCKGYGFIAFADAEDAERALKDMNGSTLLGRRIKLEIAEPRKRDIDDTLPGESRHKSYPTAAALEAKANRQQELKARNDKPGSSKLIVRNLPWSIKEPEQLATLFQSYGKIKYAVVPKKGKGVMAGFGFVTMRGRRNAEAALQGVNGKEVDERILAVDWAVEKDVWTELPSEQEGRSTTNGVTGGKQMPLPYDEHADDSGHSDVKSVEDDEKDDKPSESPEDDIELDSESETGHKVTAAKEQSSNDDRVSTLFVRNLPFATTDDELFRHFRSFGPIRYARIVLDPSTDRPRGTAFVCFAKAEDAKACIVKAPRAIITSAQQQAPSSTGEGKTRSILQSEDADPTGAYTLDGRVLQLSQAVDKIEANRLAEEGSKQREKDKRRSYLLAEGTLSKGSELYSKLSPSEISMREASATQRKKLLQSNPSLHVSLTRLSVRNIPRSITSKDLKAFARQAVVGFATDVKAGKREKLSKEELSRNGDEMVAAEHNRKRKGVGIVKQAKIVFEGQEGGKVEEKTGAGRSRGYGFIEYHSHRSALMGLRWLNGYAVGHQLNQSAKGKHAAVKHDDTKRRLIVEFAIENAQVVTRRSENERKSKVIPQSNPNEMPVATREHKDSASTVKNDRSLQDGLIQRISSNSARKPIRSSEHGANDDTSSKPDIEDDKLVKRQRIISRKRAARRDKRKADKAVAV